MTDRNQEKRAESDDTSSPLGGLGDQAFTETDAAKWLGVSRKTLANWRVLGKGCPHRKYGRSVRYYLSDLMHYRDSCLRRSTSDTGGDRG